MDSKRNRHTGCSRSFEATAIGNIMVQAVAAGQATNIASMRQLLRRITPLQTFYPEHKEIWDAAYLQFQTITQ